MVIKTKKRHKAMKIGKRLTMLIEETIRFIESPTFNKALTVIIIGVIILVSSGLIYAVIRQAPGLFFTPTEVRVYIPSIGVQSHAETFVTATFYALAFVGLLLYVWGVQQRGSERGVRYMLLFSALLLLISILGIIGGIVSKLS